MFGKFTEYVLGTHGRLGSQSESKDLGDSFGNLCVKFGILHTKITSQSSSKFTFLIETFRNVCIFYTYLRCRPSRKGFPGTRFAEVSK